MIALDTWFFFQLESKNQKAVDFWKSIIRGRISVMISVIVLYELGLITHQKGMSEFFEEIKGVVHRIQNIHLIDVDLKTIEGALKIKRSYGSPTIDSLIVANCLSNKCSRIISEDPHMIKLGNKGIIEIKRLK